MTTAAGWVVIKCWNILPLPKTLDALNGMFMTGFIVVIFLNMAREIGETSQKFLDHKKEVSGTVGMCTKNRYYFLQWNAQKSLSVRFGIQFILNMDTPFKYFEVLMTNMTDALLLINP